MQALWKNWIIYKSRFYLVILTRERFESVSYCLGLDLKSGDEKINTFPQLSVEIVSLCRGLKYKEYIHSVVDEQCSITSQYLLTNSII